MNLKKITKFDNNCAQYLISRPLFLGIGITNIIKNVGSDLWISIIIGTILGLLINYLFTKLPQKEIKYVTVFYNFILLLLSAIIVTKLISSIYLTLTPCVVVMIPFLGLIYYMAQKDENSFYNTASIVLVLNIILFIITFFSLIPTIKIDNFLPIGTTSFSKILFSSFEFAIVSTIPYITINDFKERYNYKTYLFSCLTLLFIFITIIGSLGPNLAKVYRYPEYIILKKISILSFIENVENILFSMWLYDSFILCAKAGLNIKKKTNNKFLLITLLTILIIGNYVILNSLNNTIFLIDNFTYILTATLSIFFISKIYLIIKKT